MHTHTGSNYAICLFIKLKFIHVLCTNIDCDWLKFGSTETESKREKHDEKEWHANAKMVYAAAAAVQMQMQIQISMELSIVQYRMHTSLFFDFFRLKFSVDVANTLPNRHSEYE